MACIKYLIYLLKHKWYVSADCFKYGLYWQGITHDLSKFLPSEFFPYARYFYGTRTPKVKRDFEIACEKHKRRNLHHWENWAYPVDREGKEFSTFIMPYNYIQEMLCDWYGTGKAKGNDDSNEIGIFYNSSKNNIILHPTVRSYVQHLLRTRYGAEFTNYMDA